MLDATAGSDAGIDVVSSEYATVAAEQTAQERLSKVVADQMVARLALFAAPHQPANEGGQGAAWPARSTSPIRRSASTCSTAPTKRDRARLASGCSRALGAEKFVVLGQAVKADPAMLADEAGAMSLFGGTRAIWIEPAGDEIVGRRRGPARGAGRAKAR